jgi:hypothetical protein
MIDYVIHNEDGRILQSGCVVEAMLELQADKAACRHVLAGVGEPDLHWVKAGNIVERPPLQVSVSANTVRADSSDQVLIIGVPACAAVQVVGPASGCGMADGGVLSFTFALPGTYRIVCTLFPYMDWEVSIDAV